MKQLALFDEVLEENVNYISDSHARYPLFLDYNDDSYSLHELFRQIGVPPEYVVQNNPHETLKKLIRKEEYSRMATVILETALWYSEVRLERGQEYKCSNDIFQHFKKRLAHSPQELFLTVLLNNRHEYITDLVISIGILNKCLIHPRELFCPAIKHRAGAILCVHNHPSGFPEPSDEDKRITKRLVDVGKIIGIPVIDHVIIGYDQYYSFADNGEL